MLLDIYLIRHSTTDVNADKRGAVMCGSTNAHLTEAGKELARHTKDNYPELEAVTKIYCSRLDRTVETAAEIFPARIPIIRESAFDEVDFGECELSLKNEMPEEVIDLWNNDAEKLTFPGGDSMSERAQNAYDTLKKIAGENDQPIAVVSSCTLLRLLMTRLKGMPLSTFRQIKMANCEVTHIYFDKTKQKFLIK